MEKLIKEFKQMNKTLESIKTFIIAETQLIKTLVLEVQTIKRKREIKEVLKLHQ